MGMEYEGRLSADNPGSQNGLAYTTPSGPGQAYDSHMDTTSAVSDANTATGDMPAANRQKGGLVEKTGFPEKGRPSPPPASGRNGRSLESRRSPAPRESSRSTGARRPSGPTKVCAKCGGDLTGQFVRALGDTYHLECFTCHDCGKVVASKFFPVPDHGPNQYPLCETDYFRRLDLLCFECGGALRGSYITALDRKYHIEHFTCSVCPTVFGAQDSYYEHEGNVYCHYHYSTRFAQRCNGCHTAILKQFVEIFRNGQNQHWHPECYMIHKYWNVRLASNGQLPEHDAPMDNGDVPEPERERVRHEEEAVEDKVMWIWRTLSVFEEKSATCISDMLLHVSNVSYVEGVQAARKFITHLELLFAAADRLDWLLTRDTSKGLSYSREAKLLCKKVVAFFGLLTDSQDRGVRRLGVTQELLSLVTGLAHYLKLLIRICLQGALKLERETGNSNGLKGFLDQINALDRKLDREGGASARSEMDAYLIKAADTCPICDKAVEDRCVRKGQRVFHTPCMICQNCNREIGHRLDPETYELLDARISEADNRILCLECAQNVPDAEGGLLQVSKLTQYIHLLKVAHARLLATLRTSGTLPHTSDDPNLMDYDSGSSQRAPGIAPTRATATRAKSYAGTSPNEDQGGSAYEQTLGDIRRLRSTRMDKHLSSTMKKARTSRIMGDTEGYQPGSPDNGRQGGLHIEQDRDMDADSSNQLFGNQASITLDDIPRIVATERTKEQRPNASRYARGALVASEPKPKLLNGHRRDLSTGNDLDLATAGPLGPRSKRFFSELTSLEYLIIRVASVLMMQPLLEGHFNQEELLELVETKRPTFWGKFGKAFKNDKKKDGGKKKGVFGVSLEQIVEKDGTESTDGVGPGALRIPALVQDAVSAMRTMDMSVEGVFRKNGNIRRLKETMEEIDAKGGDAVDLNKENPVQVAALLKRFLRDLPDPLMTFRLYKLFVTSQKLVDEDKRRRVLHLTCCLLPKVHRDTIEVLFTFLNWVSSFSQVDEDNGSKMDIHNLATVITPNILYEDTKTMNMDDTAFLAIEAVYTLIECNESMCEVPDDLQAILADPAFLDGSSSLSQKEILKRLSERAKVPQPTHPAEFPKSREGRSSAPVVTRVDTDPFQQNNWQEASVRHVQGPGQQFPQGPSGSNPHFDMGTPPYAYSNPSGSNEIINGSPTRQSRYRDSAFQKNSPMGVTGSG